MLRERLLQRQLVVVAADREGGDHAEGEARDRAEAAEPHPRRAPQLRVGLARALDHRAVRGDQLDRLDLAGDVAVALARAVRRGRDRARHRLHVDVAEVLEREPLGREPLAQVADHDAALDLRQPRVAVDVEHAVHAVHPDHRAVGARDVREGVAGGRHARGPACLGCAGDHRPQLLDGARMLDRRGHALLVAGPVSPHGSKPNRSVGLSLRRHGGSRDGVQSDSALLRAAMVCWRMVAAAPAAANHVQCGDTITQDTTLDSDLDVRGQRAHHRRDGVTLDLGGHTHRRAGSRRAA